MIWAILALAGIPLWFCAVEIGTLVWRNRSLGRRVGNLAVRVMTLVTECGEHIDVAGSAELTAVLLGPFATPSPGQHDRGHGG